MSYTVLARKYRPQTFADLVGQEHVSRTLGNAITGGRVAHAFLFTGARGVGKTTTARLLAKALNCEKGPTAEPCNACDACKEITVGTDLDVLEIDGASNNGVDDVRRLQETLPFRPARDRFKIVIVDEVHMLSTGAFNAFLKTLEEPPPHVKFIFATTEVHKVPITIRSRCQRYDFRLIPHAVVSARVREILEKEQIQADDAAVAIVAREAAGSMRDALTVLDQLLALGTAGEGLRGDEVARGLGIASRKAVFSTMQALIGADAAGCLRAVHAIGEQGLDVLHFAKQLLESARDMVVLRVLGDDKELLELAPDELSEVKKIAESTSKEELERAFAGLNKLVEEVGQASTPQLTLEMGLVRLADRPALLPLQELIERLRALEARLGGGGAGVGPGSPPAGPSGGGGAGSGGGGGAGRFQPPSGPGGGARAQSVNSAPAVAVTVAPKVEARSEAPAPRERRFVAPEVPEPKPEPAVVAPKSVPAAAPVTSSTPAPAPAAAPTTVREPAAQPAPALNGAIPAQWLEIVSQLKSSQPALGAVLEHGMPMEVSAKVLRIGFGDNSFFGKQAQSPVAREAILRTAELVLGARPELSFAAGAGDARVATINEVEEAARSTRKAEKKAQALSHPSVRDALEVFGETEGNLHFEQE
ncbi:MAG TPA: DNA polymerase III subunit gamma/tau [Polyangiales bacterium]|jgi:DNA polymerase-3 subunit gamma/tau|nr:DNA polymerase III subunit gamma/tau [Polyangiales bacterium]